MTFVELQMKKDFEHDDPFELTGVVFPADEQTSRSMARCFVEEFALMGFGRKEVARLFESPAFYGTTALAKRHGAAFIRQLLDEVFAEMESGDAQSS